MCSEGLQSVGGRFLQPAEKCTTQKSDCDSGKQLSPKTRPRYVEHVTGITWLVLRAARGWGGVGGGFEGRPHFFGAVNAATGRNNAAQESCCQPEFASLSWDLLGSRLHGPGWETCLSPSSSPPATREEAKDNGHLENPHRQHNKRQLNTILESL